MSEEIQLDQQQQPTQECEQLPESTQVEVESSSNQEVIESNGHEETTKLEDQSVTEVPQNGHEEKQVNGDSTKVAKQATNGSTNELEPEHFRKIFVGSLSYSTTEDTFRDHFSQYGHLVDCVIMKENKTSKSRGFGFVTYDKMTCVDEVMRARPHKLDNRELEVKRATPREESGKPGAEASTNKLFVGAIKDGLGEEQLREYFGKYGQIDDCVIMRDKETQKPRGFGFVTFSDYDPVDKVVLEKFHVVAGQSVAVKKAMPKQEGQSDRPYNNNHHSGPSHHMNNNNKRPMNSQHNGNMNNNHGPKNFKNNYRGNQPQHQRNGRGGGGGGDSNQMNGGSNDSGMNGQGLFGNFGNNMGSGGMNGSGNGSSAAPGLMGMPNNVNQFASLAQKMFEAMGNQGQMPTSLFGMPNTMMNGSSGNSANGNNNNNGFRNKNGRSMNGGGMGGPMSNGGGQMSNGHSNGGGGGYGGGYNMEPDVGGFNNNGNHMNNNYGPKAAVGGPMRPNPMSGGRGRNNGPYNPTMRRGGRH